MIRSLLAAVLSFGLAGTAQADFLFTQGTGTTAVGFDATHSGTGRCGAAGTVCFGFVPMDTTGSFLFSTANPGLVSPATVATWGLAAATQNVATPTNGQLAMGQFNTTPTTITSGNTSPLQLDNAGNLLVNVKVGGGTGGGGGGAVTIASGADVTEGTAADAAFAGTGSATVVAALKGIYAVASSPIPAGSNVIGGMTVADGASVALGAKADTAYAGSGAASVVAELKGIYTAASSPLPLGTTGGWTPFLANGLTTTLKTVKNAIGQLGGVQCYNPNSVQAYVQFFNSATPTLGTTAPTLSVPIGPTSTGGMAIAMVGIQFSTVITMVATSTATGSVAPTTALDCNVWYN